MLELKFYEFEQKSLLFKKREREKRREKSLVSVRSRQVGLCFVGGNLFFFSFSKRRGKREKKKRNEREREQQREREKKKKKKRGFSLMIKHNREKNFDGKNWD